MKEEQKERANLLRKNGELKEALLIYKELYESNEQDKFDAAGYLQCLRKLKSHKKAVEVALECEKIYSDFNWCRLEVIWTYISEIKRVEETESMVSILSLATRIMNLKPDYLQTNITVLAVLKIAKQLKRWDIASQWVDKVNSDTLDKTPIVVRDKMTVWSEYLIWQKHKVTCLIYQKEYHKAIERLESIRTQTNQVRKYFLVLEVDALLKLGKEDKAISILTELTRNPKADWWIVHRFAIALNDMGEKEHALKEMYRAASLSYKIENSINLLKNIFLLTKELDRMEEAYYHLLLFKLIREKMGWSIHEEIDKQLKIISTSMNNQLLQKYHEVLQKCRSYWEQETNVTIEKSTKKLKRSLSGSLVQVRKDRAFCFIKTQQDSFFCHVSDIRGPAVEGMVVQFDAVPTYDIKKQKESWKAINVVEVQRG